MFFVEIVDWFECVIDTMGPFASENDAHNAAWEKWDGDDTMQTSRIVFG